jgi:hypothetical protein
MTVVDVATNAYRKWCKEHMLPRSISTDIGKPSMKGRVLHNRHDHDDNQVHLYSAGLYSIECSLHM